MRVQSLGPENHLGEEMATHSSILAWRIPRTENLAGHSPWGLKGSDATEQLSNWARMQYLKKIETRKDQIKVALINKGQNVTEKNEV